MWNPFSPQARIAGLIRIALGISLFLSVPVHVATAQGSAAASLTPELTRVRTALDKYKDPIMAVHDGYMSLVGCIDYPKGASEGTMQYVAGGMGVHFLNPSLVGPKLDPMKPPVLIYEPTSDDKLRLVAAEWFMPDQLATDGAPKIFGRTLEGPMEGHKPLMPTELHHYDLHVWLWKDNPAGIYSPTNPALKCPSKGYSFSEGAPKMVGHNPHHTPERQ